MRNEVKVEVLPSGSFLINIPLVEEEYEKFRQDLINELEKEEIPVVAEIERKEGVSFFEVFTDLDKDKIESLSNRLIRKKGGGKCT